MVQLRFSFLLLGLLKGLCLSTPSLERLIGNSLIFLLGSFIVQFKVFIDFHCHKNSNHKEACSSHVRSLKVSGILTGRECRLDVL